MGKIQKQYQALFEIADKLFNLTIRGSLNENLVLVDDFINAYKNTITSSKEKHHNLIKSTITHLKLACIHNEDLKNLLISELHLNDPNYYDLWKYYIEDMLYFHTFRTFNYDFLVDGANYYLSQQTFDINNYVHKNILDNILNYHYDKVYNYYPLDNTYNKELSKPLIDFLSEPLKKELNDIQLCISEDEKLAYKDIINKEIHTHFSENYIANININFDEKTKFKFPKKYSTSYSINLYDLNNEYNPLKKIDHKSDVERLLANPTPINLYFYLINVLSGEPHYTSLNKWIENIINNIKVSIHDIGYDLTGDNLFINVICKFYMMYFGIALPENKFKALEHLGFNMNVLTKHPEYTSVILKTLSYDIHSIITSNPTNTTEFITTCLNPYYLNETNLTKYLDSKNDDELYKILKEFEINNSYIFDSIIKKYKKVYNKGLKADKEKELELERQALIQKQKELEELEKQKKEQELIDKKNKASEKLKASINDTQEELTDEQLLTLSSQTNDANAMFKVADHYFNLGKSDKKYYQLSYHYYNIVGDLGNVVGYVNAAISKNNMNTTLAKNSPEYNQNVDDALTTLEKAKPSAYIYFIYAYYASDNMLPKYKEYIETTYPIIMNNPKTSENAKTVMKAAYAFHQDDYYNAIYYFDLIKEYTTRSMISIVTNRLLDKLYNWSKKFPFPQPQEFINPFSKEYDEYKNKYNQFSTADTAIRKGKEFIEWASSLNDSYANKYKAYCLYYGNFYYEKNHEQAYELLTKYEQTISNTDETYNKILNELKLEFKTKNKKKKSAV